MKGSTLAGIASSAGVVTNSVTCHYRRNEDLAIACFLRAIAACDELAFAAARSDGVPARVQAFFRLQAQRMVDIEEGRHAALVIFHDLRALPEPQATEVFAAYIAMFRRVRTLLKGSETRHLGRADLDARSHILLSIANAAPAWIGRCEASEYGAIAGRIGDILVLGIGGRGASWPMASARAPWRLAGSEEGPSDAFLRAATELVNEQGYRGASVDKISARLNVTKGSFHHHNDTKPRSDLRVLRAQFHRDAPSPRPSRCQPRQRLEPRLRIGMRAGSCSALGSLAVAACIAHQRPPRPGTTRARAPNPAPPLRRLAERVTGVLVDGTTGGSIRPLDPAIAVHIAFAAINAAAEHQGWVPDADTRNVGGLYVRAVLQGLVCPGVLAGWPADGLTG